MGLLDRFPSPSRAALYLLASLLTAAAVSAILVLAGPVGDLHGTRYATVDLGVQPNDVAKGVSPGDTMRLGDGAGRLAVTDSVTTPAGDGEYLVTVRAELEREARIPELFDKGALYLDGSRVRPGDTVTVETLQYSLEGDVVSVDASGPHLHDRWSAVSLDRPNPRPDALTASA